MKESSCEPNTIWDDKGSKLNNRSINSRSKSNDIELYWTQNKGKPVVAELFIIGLTNKIYKYMTVIRKNMYINRLMNKTILFIVW